MDNESEQVSDISSPHSKSGLYSLWLGVFSIVFCVIGQVLARVMYHKNAPDIYRTLQEPITLLGFMCGLLAVLIGRIAYYRNRKLGGDRDKKVAHIGTVLGILAFVPACLFVCGFVLLALATGSQIP
jgi:hypothetical protein